MSRAGQWNDIASLLQNLKFVCGKCSVGLAYDLVGDYQVESDQPKAFEKEQRRILDSSAVLAFGGFVSRNAHILSIKPMLTLQQALNEPEGVVSAAAAREIASSKCL
jgi:hypothetical protein